MPHIAEGLLHAHLDGALGPDGQLEWAAAERHLEDCADCRGRLEEARELRTRARGLFAGAAPSVPPGPGFEALAAEAEARGRTGGRAGLWRSTARLAWAASLVIAAGAGWIGHELLMQQSPVASRSSAGTPAAETVGVVAERREDEVSRGARMTEQARAEPEAAFDADADQAAAARQPAREPEAAEKTMMPQAAPELDDRAREGIAGPSCFAPTAEIRESGLPGLPGPLDTLVLAPDGTLRFEAGGRPLVGFWDALSADSLRLRLTDGSEWLDYRVRRSGEGLSGISVDGGAVGFRSAACSP